MIVKVDAELVTKREIAKGIYLFAVKAEELANQAKPGQFLEIRVQDQVEPYLRRPISIYNLRKEEGIVEFIFQVKGKGTKILAQKEIGDTIDLFGPLGYGCFEYEGHQSISIIGGGIGIFPLYELAKQAHNSKMKVNTYLGFRNKAFVVLENEFEGVSDQLAITTDDGSYQTKGFCIDVLREDIKKQKTDCIYCCGPMPLIKAVKKLAEEYDIPCQISLEERMGCGLGACLGCAVKVKNGEKESYFHVCKMGPVFDAKDVILE